MHGVKNASVTQIQASRTHLKSIGQVLSDSNTTRILETIIISEIDPFISLSIVADYEGSLTEVIYYHVYGTYEFAQAERETVGPCTLQWWDNNTTVNSTDTVRISDEF